MTNAQAKLRVAMGEAERKLRNARAVVVQGHTFFGSLLLRQQLVESHEVETLATDGERIYFNPEYVEQQSTDLLQFDVAHEALHPAFCHHTRRGNRDPRTWNEAADMIINPILVDAGFTMPADALLREDIAALGNVERAYAQLWAEKMAQQQQQQSDEQDDDGEESDDQQQGGGAGDDDGEGDESDESRSNGAGDESDGEGDDDQQGDDESGSGSATGGQGGKGKPKIKYPSVGGAGWLMDAPVENEAERQTEEAKWKVAVAQAANVARQAGDLPSCLDVAIRALLKPRVDWRDQLRKYMDQFAQLDYTWMRPNRRHIADGTYLPSMHSEQLPRILMVIDASGSMPDAALAAAGSEIQDICSTLRPEALDVIVHDTSVTGFQTFEPDQPVEIDVPGRGGTCFEPVCDWIAERDEQYCCVIWFTDLQAGDWDEAARKAPQQPVLWIDYADSEFVAPFGDETIRMPRDLWLEDAA